MRIFIIFVAIALALPLEDQLLSDEDSQLDVASAGFQPIEIQPTDVEPTDVEITNVEIIDSQYVASGCPNTRSKRNEISDVQIVLNKIIDGKTKGDGNWTPPKSGSYPRQRFLQKREKHNKLLPVGKAPRDPCVGDAVAHWLTFYNYCKQQMTIFDRKFCTDEANDLVDCNWDPDKPPPDPPLPPANRRQCPS